MMKLKLKKNGKHSHQDVVSSVCWASNNQLYSLSDDKTICIWDINGEFVSKFLDLDCYCTAMQWGPGSKSGNEALAIGTSEGALRIISRSGKIEKVVEEAHTTAIICIKWSSDGQSIATAGEDGQVKIWSRLGVWRANLVQSNTPVYSISLSHDETFLIYTSDKNLSIKPVLKGGLKTLSWKAHDEIVLCVDWSYSNKLILSGGEDRRYKIWDQYGRNLFTSAPYNYVTTSVSWAPSGEYLAIGSFDMIRLCNKTGWTYSFNKIDSGSIFNISWSADGTTLCGAGGNGSVIFGQLVDRTVSWQNIEVRLDESNKLVIHDYHHDVSAEIDFKERLIDMTIGYNFLIVVTMNQCHIYNINYIQSPYSFDLKEKVKLILTSPKYFALVHDNNGINIYSYEGKPIQSPQISGVRVSSLTKKMIALSNDIVAILAPTAPKSIRLYDLASGKALTYTIEHTMDILELALNQSELSRDRKVCFIDTNKDLYIANVYTNKVVKIMNMCDTFCWNDSNDMLACIADEKFYAWVYPNAVYLDKEILDGCKYEKDASDAGRNCQILNFTGSFCNILKSDGSLCSKTITPYAGILLNLLNFQDGIERGLKLCRYVKDKILWTAFSAICINYREIQIAETAVASIDEVDKVGFIEKIIKLRDEKYNENLITSYVLLLSNKLDEAENVLVQGKLIYRAIKMNINLFRWDRALNIALSHKQHIDTVLAYRQKYLSSVSLEETNSKFMELAKEIAIDWEKIKSKIADDKRLESGKKE